MKVFISYKRNVEPDQMLAQEISAVLTAAGHRAFVDAKLKVGQSWAKEIETQVRQADYLIVLLTKESSRSEMVRGEIEIARAQARVNATPTILPVRVAFSGSLPYPLNAYLDDIRYASWRGLQDTAQLLHDLQVAMTDQLASHEATSLWAQRPMTLPTAILDIDEPFYVARAGDALVMRLIENRGQTLTISGYRQMGKTFLLMRALKKAVDIGKRVALVDLQLVDTLTKADANMFFRWFASSLSEQLELPEMAPEAWDAQFSNTQSCNSLYGTMHSRAAGSTGRHRHRQPRFPYTGAILARSSRDDSQLARPARTPCSAHLAIARPPRRDLGRLVDR